MYLIEWGWWQMQKESAATRQEMEALQTPAQRRSDKDFYEDDIASELHFNSVSEKPHLRGPVFAFNDTYLEIRCGGMEEKRGLITLMSVGGFGVCAVMWVKLTASFIYLNTQWSHPFNPVLLLLLSITLLIGAGLFYFYFKYGFQFTRLEMLTSRHLLVRFNRKTQQVHLHRPAYCGGISTFSWRSTGSTAIDPDEDSLSLGMRLGLIWHPSQTGLPHLEMALIGKQGQGGSELRDEWEFIRRYMEEGPDSVPRPRLSTQLPSLLQAFSAQFEGLGRFLRKSSWLMKVVLLMVWPAFVVLGGSHWLSLMLCWRPRWPKVIREAGQPGKPTPPLTTLDDYPPKVRERLLANADRWHLKPGKRPEKKPRAPSRRAKKIEKDPIS
ncbi:DUF6708 domain-containing protein [Pseudomonas fontis]|uniref:DUF6708 domain-containing protein n=1 Tax=Pseudomonas fontis TaxID=2942633 RepID=A0ABT5P030_9PSED|nr:hypothetical protein [Pseudomonas fontis]MDD0972957.1 hypothetical protein [Pseudomonas fontis]MDD0993809.1 hypothetical protein [Pseudomonas fontis]